MISFAPLGLGGFIGADSPIAHAMGYVLTPATQADARTILHDSKREDGKLAASLKAQFNLPYADSFTAALSQVHKATVVTSDKDFERAGTAIKILLI